MTADSGSPEATYFLQREQQLRERTRKDLERKAEETRKRRELGENLGTDDEALIARIRALGIEGEAARMLHLLPLVSIAWSDGSVSDAERRTIMRVVRAQGAEPGSDAANYIASLLETRPSETLIDEVAKIMADLLKAKGLRPDSLMELCDDVAKASGGLLGFGDKMSAAERAEIERIGSSLSAEAHEQMRERIRTRLDEAGS